MFLPSVKPSALEHLVPKSPSSVALPFQQAMLLEVAEKQALKMHGFLQTQGAQHRESWGYGDCSLQVEAGLEDKKISHESEEQMSRRD